MKVIAKENVGKLSASFVAGRTYNADNYSSGTSIVYNGEGASLACQTVELLEHFTPEQPTVPLGPVIACDFHRQ